MARPNRRVPLPGKLTTGERTMLKQVKTLKERYRTHEGARKRCAFENGIAKGEYERGDKAKNYKYTIDFDVAVWRVVRNIETQE
jgi:hypothetical protein